MASTGEPLYTAAACRTRIKEIDTLIAEVAEVPAQQGGDGLYASYAGRISDLRKERTTWENRLETAEQWEDEQAAHGLQGPRFKV